MSKRRIIILIVGGAFLSLCACLSILVAIAPDSETETAVSEDVRVQEIDVSEEVAEAETAVSSDPTAEPVETAVPSTDIPDPTAEPTETAVPTAEPTETAVPPTDTPVPPTNTPKPTRTPKTTNTPVPQVEISASSVNVRGGPGTDYESIGSLASGDVVNVVAQTNDASWYVIELDNGTTGWVGAGATTAVSGMDNIPTAATIPAPPPTALPPTAAPPTQVPATAIPPTPIPPTAVPPTAAPPTAVPQPTSPPAPTEPPVQSAAQVVITYVNKGDEYVDIKNNGGTDQDLSGWMLRSEKGNQDCWLNGMLPAGATLRIWAMSEDVGQGGFNCGFGSNIWNNSSSDPAVLFDASGAEVDRR